jgi:hypothetical protein
MDLPSLSQSEDNTAGVPFLQVAGLVSRVATNCGELHAVLHHHMGKLGVMDVGYKGRHACKRYKPNKLNTWHGKIFCPSRRRRSRS